MLRLFAFLLSLVAAVYSQNSSASEFLPSQEECGQVVLSYRIVGGKTIKKGGFPWMAVLGKISQTSGLLLPSCGGTLVSKNYILSAATCFVSITNSPDRVRIGEYDYISEYDTYDHQEFFISQVKLNNFNKTDRYNDIALIKIDRPVTYSDLVKPACLPFNLEKQSFVHTKLTAVGWGAKSNYGSNSNVPLSVEISMVGTHNCAEDYEKTRNVTDKLNLCGGTVKANVCPGDNGAPLHYLDPETSKYVVVGITSTYGCTRKTTIFTKVASHLDWIRENVDK